MYVIAGVTEHVGSVAAKELLAKKKPLKVIVRDAKKGETWSKQGACYVMFPENAGFTKTKELAINRGNEYETRYGSTISESFAYQQGRHVQGSRRPRGHPIRGTHGSGTCGR